MLAILSQTIFTSSIPAQQALDRVRIVCSLSQRIVDKSIGQPANCECDSCHTRTLHFTPCHSAYTFQLSEYHNLLLTMGKKRFLFYLIKSVMRLNRI